VTIVSVAAPGNGSGKTTALASILSAFPGRFTAVKFTTVFRDGVNCPRTEKACACRELHGAYTVVTDPAILAMAESDTGRLTRSGARAVLWCLARPGAHAEAWAHLRQGLLPEGAVLLTEGNSIVPWIDPDLLIMVMSPLLPKGRWKQDAWDLARRADVVVVNPRGADRDDVESLVEETAARCAGLRPPVVDVAASLESWDGGSIAARVAAALAAPRRHRAHPMAGRP